jgi:hypothetical protein
MNGATTKEEKESSTTPNPSLKRRGATYTKVSWPNGLFGYNALLFQVY